MECEEVQICDICGDAGYADELTICDQCNDSVEHIYCMTTMLDHVPLHWICERCETEKKRNAKKRLLGNETIPIEADKKSTKAKLSSWPEENRTKNAGSIPKLSSQSSLRVPINNSRPTLSSQNSVPLNNSRPGNNSALKSTITQSLAEKGYLSAARTLNSYQKVVPDGTKSRPSLPKSECEVDNTAGQPSSRSSLGCHVSLHVNTNVNGKDEPISCKFPSDMPCTGSKHLYSRSSSFPARVGQSAFPLASRQKELMRSKSTLQYSAILSSATSVKNSKRDLCGHEYKKPLTYGTKGLAVHEASIPMENSRSTSGHKQECNKLVTHGTHGISVREASKPMQSSKSTFAIGSTANNKAGEDKNKQHDQSSRNSELLQNHCHGGNFGKADFQSLKGQLKCFKCDKEGHVAVQCTHLGSGSGRPHEAQKPLASFDKTIAANCSILETPSNLQTPENLNSPKEITQWKLSNCPVTSKVASDQTQTCGKEALATPGTVNSDHLCSPKLWDNKQSVEMQLQNSKGNIGFRGAVQSQMDGIQGAAHDTNVLKNHNRLQCNSLMSCSNSCNGCGSSELASTEAGLAVNTSTGPHSEILAEPCVQILWSGRFNVLSTFLTYNGMQAHASSKADPQVAEAVRNLPFELRLEELKRGVETNTWPCSLQNRPPTRSSIGVYFFPMDMECHDTWYKPLLDHLVANDLALKTSMDISELLIFPSHLLPEADQCWDDRQYLWGILRN